MFPARHCSTTFQPLGMPLELSAVQPVMPAALVNVPEAATPSSQFFVQPLAEISVARQVTLARLVQPWNMLL